MCGSLLTFLVEGHKLWFPTLIFSRESQIVIPLDGKAKMARDTLKRKWIGTNIFNGKRYLSPPLGVAERGSGK